MHARVTLVGLDCGSTTCRALVSTAVLCENRATGRSELADVVTAYRGGPAFTPFAGDALDLPALAALLDGWLADACLAPGAALWGGGALVTGLAARASNADALVAWIRARLGDVVVATARDPGLESWLAFMGSARALSLAEPARTFLHLDVGGGTTNLALALAGEVTAVGCAAIGARHVRVKRSTTCVMGASETGLRLARELGLDLAPGRDAPAADLARFAARQAQGLAALVAGDPTAGGLPWLVELPLAVPPDSAPVVTFSGGVGELVYRLAAGDSLEEPAPFGDLGCELARAILAVPALAAHVRSHAPPGGGRATVEGLALFATEVSGSTVFAPRADLLPLHDLPVVAQLPAQPAPGELARALALVRHCPGGAALGLALTDASLASVRAAGDALRAALAAAALPPDRPVVLLTPANVGRTLGNLATGWGHLAAALFVVDEVPPRAARFVSVGAPRHGVLPVSFRGLG